MKRPCNRKISNEKMTEELNKVSDDVNNIKFGHFQLQTKSFWLSLVTALCIFLIATFVMNYKTMQCVMKHNEQVITILLTHASTNHDALEESKE